MCDLCRVQRSYPSWCIGEDGKFDEVEMERWDRDLGRPTNAHIARRHDLDRRKAIMERKLRELCTKSVIVEWYYPSDLLHGKPGHVGVAPVDGSSPSRPMCCGRYECATASVSPAGTTPGGPV